MTNQRRVGVIVSLLLSAIAVQAQTYIFGRADFAVGKGAISIAMGDFNGDGITDLAVVNEADNTVSILLGKSDSTFAAQVTYATGVGPVAIVTGDFNGDGNLDLAITNGDCTIGIPQATTCDGSTVSILLGNGDGSFRPHVDYPTGNHPSSVAAGDFSGNGKLDLAITSIQGGVSVLLGNGDGTFQAPVEYAASTSQTAFVADSVIVADFNGDGKLDLAVGGGTGVAVLLGNGNGTFQAALNAQGSPPLAAADFNLDGKLDLFAGGDVLLGNGDGTFTLYATYPSGYAAAAADLNGDGKPDLVVADQVTNQGSVSDFSPYSVAVLLGNGDGSFQTAALYATAVDPEEVHIADFNGDGKFDLAVADPGCIPFGCSTPGAASILLGFGDGTFVGGVNYSLPGAIVDQVISADFNGDGKPDMAARGGPASVNVFIGNGDGTFQPVVSTTLTQVGGGNAAGDFNGDGKADIVTVFTNCSTSPPITCLPGDAVVLIGNGDGTFQTPVEYTVGLQSNGSYENVAVADFNGDGAPDIAVTNFGANTVSILLNTGNGTFQSHVDYPAGTEPTSIVTGDFNGDGIVDLAILDSIGISILLGNGNGTFIAGTPLTGLSPYAMAVGDFNGDGKLDLAVTTNETQGTIFILLGNGDGTFQRLVGYPDGQELGLPSVGDLNGDGKLDLIVSPSAYGHVASILLGNGDGSFQAPIFNFLMNLSNIAVADFNSDGSPDLAGGQGSSTGNSVAVMLSAAFKAVSPASLNFGSQGVGTTSVTQTITISNPSTVNISIASIAASGNFHQTNNCGASLPIGSQCAVNVTFTPSATGLESGAITLTDNTRISPLAIPLSGTGVSGAFLTPSPSRTNFAPQAVGTSSTPAPIVLLNTGNASLNINGISITGADASNFTQSNNCGSSLPPAGSCTVKVTFTPTAGGSRTASLAVSDTAPGSPQSASLVGTGLGPIANATPSSLSFAAQAVGTKSTAQVVTLTNGGDAALNLTQIAAVGDFSETNTCSASLAAGSSCQISVTFEPTSTGNRAGSITIADNAVGSPQTVALAGTGVPAPDFSVGAAPGSSTSQTISAGQSAKFSLVVTPSGSFSGTVNLSCSLSPMVSVAPTCSLSSSSVKISGSAAQPVTVTIATTAPVTTGTVSHVDFTPGARPMTWTVMLLMSGWLLLRNRRRLPSLTVPLIVLALASWVGCGGGGGSSSQTTAGTPNGTYTATITATSGSQNDKMTLTLVVQ
jgi:FG-GAP-like repeat/Abnormal spindle-like microcephaly-assoc'd, ASPM-SPD-2-Hydin